MSDLMVQQGAGELFMPVLNIDQIIQKRKLIGDFYNAVMVRGVDYGVIPGTEKPALHKPGAEKLCSLFGLAVKPTIIEKAEDWTGAEHGGESFFYYHYRVGLWRGANLITEAEGSCNSFETKYRWRKGERTCPACGFPSIIKGREEYGGGWICFQKKGGCGAKFAANDTSITGQVVGRVTNPDVADAVNTIQKMALKRAYVAAVLLATGASEFFTQDVEDFQAGGYESGPADEPPYENGGSHGGGYGTGHTSGRNGVPQQQQQQAAPRPANGQQRPAQPSGTTADAEKSWQAACDTAGMPDDATSRAELLASLLTDHFRGIDPRHPGVKPNPKGKFHPTQYRVAIDMLTARSTEVASPAWAVQAETPSENTAPDPPPADPSADRSAKSASARGTKSERAGPAKDPYANDVCPACKATGRAAMECGCDQDAIDAALQDEEAARMTGSLGLDVAEPASNPTVAAVAR